MIPTPLPFETELYDLELDILRRETDGEDAEETKRLRTELNTKKRARFANLSPWETVLVSRHPNRPQTCDYIDTVFDEFVELHGDRAIGDDRAIRTGFARLDGQKVMLIGHHKGRNLAERTQCFYGCAHPEGYRKALCKMQLAAKFGVPMICLIDTPGAYPGIGAEERGQSQLIATSILEMTLLRAPIICVVIGEGGSGGALGIGIGDRVAIMQHAYYSVISPEGCAGILWKTANEETKPRAAEALRLNAQFLKDQGVVDEIIPEPLGGAHRNPREMAVTLRGYLSRTVSELQSLDTDTLLEQRYQKFRKLGPYLETAAS
jgi:acetyl-CoA carboxylase carboxyl transferase subunit alpha